MRAVIAELEAFVRAALVEPVPRNHTESDARFRRRQVVAVVTLVVGALVLGWALRIEPGNDLFYLGTLALAAVWLIGALASGRLHLGHALTRRGVHARPILQPIVVGLILLGVFCLGALLVARIPLLRSPVQDLLDHARFGSLPVVAVITAVTGIAEELYFRGALYASVGRRHAVLVTTSVYVLVTAASGIPLLVFAAAILGVVVGLQRRVTGGVLGPIITHLIWSLGMLFLLPPLFAWAS